MGRYLKLYFQTVRLPNYIVRPARTKTIAIVNEAFGTHCPDFIVKHSQNYPYSCGTDGSNDTGIQKMNPASIRIYDANTSKVVTNHFYNMCMTEAEWCYS